MTHLTLTTLTFTPALPKKKKKKSIHFKRLCQEEVNRWACQGTQLYLNYLCPHFPLESMATYTWGRKRNWTIHNETVGTETPGLQGRVHRRSRVLRFLHGRFCRPGMAQYDGTVDVLLPVTEVVCVPFQLGHWIPRCVETFVLVSGVSRFWPSMFCDPSPPPPPCLI